MSHLRAFLAILLAATWCSAVWHVDLEAVGLILEHRHHHHGGVDHHAPLAENHGHEPVVVRDVVKDAQIRVGTVIALFVATLGMFLAVAIRLGRPEDEAEPASSGGPPEPPWRSIWLFMQRCAPESVAPPALA